MTEAFRVACIQNCAGPVLEHNLEESSRLAREARDAGADLLCLPEFVSCLEVTDTGLEVGPAPEDSHPALARYRDLARELEAWLLVGSLAVRTASGGVRNRSLLLDAGGEVVARYDKLHLFDVDLGGGERYRESDTFEAGDEAVVAETPWARLGMSVCYDLRFAYLYRALAQAGAEVLAVPAAFTRTTGQAHWHVLLRARAIETGSWVVAPAQYGRHGKGETYAHALVVDPWGEVVADAGEAPGFAVAEIDLSRVESARRRVPALRHDRGLRVRHARAGAPV